MIYFAAIGLILTLAGFSRRARVDGLRSTLLDLAAAAVVGWVSGLLIGVGARIGMWIIPLINGVESRFTIDGTLQVILVFSLFGIGLGLIYEFIFRGPLANRGLLFGVTVTLVTAYPLAAAGLQQITFKPEIAPTVGLSLFVVGMMFIPFAVALETLLRVYHRLRGNRYLASAQMRT